MYALRPQRFSNVARAQCFTTTVKRKHSNGHQIKDNLARKPQGNDRAQVKAIWAGECDISIGNTYYMGKMLNDPEQTAWANDVRIVFPTFEKGETHINISGVADGKNAPNADNALALIEFLTSKQAQEIYADANFEYPVAPGSVPNDLVKSWGDYVPDDVNLMDSSSTSQPSAEAYRDSRFRRVNK